MFRLGRHCRCHWPALAYWGRVPHSSGPPRHRAHRARDHRNRDAHHHRAQLHRAAAPPRGPRPATTQRRNRPGRSPPPPCPIVHRAAPRCRTAPPRPATTATGALTTTVPNCTHTAAPRCRTAPHRPRPLRPGRSPPPCPIVHRAAPRTLPHRAAAPATTATANQDAHRTPHPCPINYTTLPRCHAATCAVLSLTPCRRDAPSRFLRF